MLKRKILLFIYFLLLASTIVIAQSEDQWIGTWTSESFKALDSESEEHVYTDFRYMIKITKSEDGYFVRAKTVKVADPASAIYNDACGIRQFVKKTEGNTMLLESRRDKIPFYENGKIDSYSSTTSYYRLTISKDFLHFSFYKYVVESFDNNMKYEYTTTYGLHEQNSGPCLERDLYNDDW